MKKNILIFILTLVIIILTNKNSFCQANCKDDIVIMKTSYLDSCFFQPVQVVWLDDDLYLPIDYTTVPGSDPWKCDCQTLKMVKGKNTRIFGMKNNSDTLRSKIRLVVLNYYTVQKTVRVRFDIVEDNQFIYTTTDQWNLPAGVFGTTCNTPSTTVINVNTPIPGTGQPAFRFNNVGIKNIKMELTDGNGAFFTDAKVSNHQHLMQCYVDSTQKIRLGIQPLFFNDEPLAYYPPNFFNFNSLLHNSFRVTSENQAHFLFDTYPVREDINYRYISFGLTQFVLRDLGGIPVTQNRWVNVLNNDQRTEIWSNLLIDITGGLSGLDRVIYVTGDHNGNGITSAYDGQNSGVEGVSTSDAVGKKAFWINIINSAPYLNLSTVSHELGHTFNLPVNPLGGEEYSSGPPAIDGMRARGYWINLNAYRPFNSTTRSVCFMGNLSGLDSQWVDKNDYRRLLNAFTSPHLDPQVIHVRAVISNTNNVRLFPFYTYTSSSADFVNQSTTGRYIIKTRNNLGGLIKQFAFNGRFSFHVDYLGTNAITNIPVSVTLENDPLIKTIQICDSTGNVIASKTKSTNPPVINVTYPNGGEMLGGDSIQIRWTSSDADNDTLYHSILVSSDNGTNWIPVVSDIKGDNYWLKLFFHNLSGNNFKIKVFASDGFNTSYDSSSNPFTIGIKLLSQNVPVAYRLYQNYPNPFNPKTKIRFDIVKYSFTRIFIYDILGREIEELVNQQLKPGNYEIEWDGSNYSSGVYFYKIVAGEYINTKEMILLK